MTTTVHRLRLLAILWCLLVSTLYVLTVEAQIPCSDRNIGPVTDVGDSVSLSALCYPNGSAVFFWSAQDDSVRRIQIEYECYTSSDTTEPNPLVVIAWTHIRDGSYVTEDIWDENTTCTFYGCYETEIGFLFDKRWIPSTNCTAQFQPAITDGPVDTETEYPHNVSLNCTARGVPVPEFTWTVDFGSGTVDVMDSGQVDIITVPTGTPNEHTSILTLMSMGPFTATYTCHVSNLLGSDSSAAMLNVQEIVPTTTVTTRSLSDGLLPSSTPTGPTTSKPSPLGTGHFIAIALGATVIGFIIVIGIILISCRYSARKPITVNIENKMYLQVLNLPAPYQGDVDGDFNPVDATLQTMSTLESDLEKYTRLFSKSDTGLNEVPQGVENPLECIEENEPINQTQVELTIEERDDSYCDPPDLGIPIPEEGLEMPFEPTSSTECSTNLVQNDEGYVVEQTNSGTTIPGSGSTVLTQAL